MTAPDVAHVTHFDDCGCKTARYEAAAARLRQERDSWRVIARDKDEEIARLMVVKVLVPADRAAQPEAKPAPNDDALQVKWYEMATYIALFCYRERTRGVRDLRFGEIKDTNNIAAEEGIE
jgi:hypothetical protein